MANELIERELEQEPESSGLARIVSEGDPDMMLAVLEKKAALAGRMRAAIEHILVSQTYEQDWTQQGDKACLSSAGAERIARNFPITFSDVKWAKEKFSDSQGEGYRYVYTGNAQLYDRTVYAEGSYSTRDEFLGKKSGAWRPLEDINEGDIRSAAHHIFCGNAIKELLGLRGMPWAEYERVMKGTGRDASKSSSVSRGSGTDGGTSQDDVKHQQELTKLCMGFAHDGYTVEQDGSGKWSLCLLSDSDARDATEIAKDICIKISSFKGKDGTTVPGKLSKELKDKRLSATLSTARKLKESQPANSDGFPGE